MSDDRTERGQFDPQYESADVLAAFRAEAVPILTSVEVAEAVGCSEPTARRRLDEFAAEGILYRKHVGPRATVYGRHGDARTVGYSEWGRSPEDEE